MSGRADVLAYGALAGASPVDAILDLQRTHGNQAVVELIARHDVIQRQVAAGEVDPAMRVQLLRDAIRVEAFPVPMFKIDIAAAAEALSGLTPAEGRAIRDGFREQKHWNLGWIFAGQESLLEGGAPSGNNLSSAERKRLLNLLKGTVAPAAADDGTAPPSADVAIAQTSHWNSVAAGLKSAIDRKDIEAVMTAIPAAPDDRRILDATYQRHFGETAYVALLTRLGGRASMRANASWLGDRVTADRLALEEAADARAKVEARMDRMQAVAEFAGQGDEVKQRRKDATDKVEQQVRQVARGSDQDTAAGRAAGREHLQQVLGKDDPGGVLAARIGIGKDAVMTAIAQGDEPEELGARLARADAERDLTPAEVESVLRELRQLAQATTERTVDAQPEEMRAPMRSALGNLVIEGYYERFTATFDKTHVKRRFADVLVGKAGAQEKSLGILGITVDQAREASGTSGDVVRNQALLAQRGELPEWQELYLALNRKPRDMVRVRTILETKTRTQVEELSGEYTRMTGLRSLEVDLEGTEMEQAVGMIDHESREATAERRALLQGGRFDARAALAAIPASLDDETREARFLAAEGRWLFGRIGALERRVIENQGGFAEVRDMVGNEERSMLDVARADAADAKGALERALTPDRGTTWKPGEEGSAPRPDLVAARTHVRELERVQTRLEHAVGLYKEATRKAYDEFVDAAVMIASTAAGLGVTGIWLTAIRTTAATVGTKMLLKGNDYSVDEFLDDVRGGVAGMAGDAAKLGVKHLVAPYVAGQLASLARKVGMSPAFYAKVAAAIGPVTLRQAEYTIGTGVSNVGQGKGFWEDQGAGARLKGEAIGQVTGAIEETYLKKPTPDGNRDDGVEAADADSTVGGPARHSEIAGADHSKARSHSASGGLPARTSTTGIGGRTAETDIARVPMRLEPETGLPVARSPETPAAPRESLHEENERRRKERNKRRQPLTPEEQAQARARQYAAEEAARQQVDAELRRARAEVERLAGDAPDSPVRLAAEAEFQVAVSAHEQSRAALAAAHARARQYQSEEPESPIRRAAAEEFESAQAAHRTTRAALETAGANAAKYRGEPPDSPARRAADADLEAAQRAHDDAYAPPKDWDEQMVIHLKDTPTSFREHEQVFFKMLQEDPTREVGLFRNDTTGEMVIVRGKKGVVSVETDKSKPEGRQEQGLAPGAEVQRWKEILADRSKVGHWELMSHTHPSPEMHLPAPTRMRYASGTDGDMAVVQHDSEVSGGQPKASRIFYLGEGGQRMVTDFGYDPRNAAEPFWIAVPGEPPLRFADIPAYDRHLATIRDT